MMRWEQCQGKQGGLNRLGMIISIIPVSLMAINITMASIIPVVITTKGTRIQITGITIIRLGISVIEKDDMRSKGAQGE